jgi:hypothetical protein
MYLVAYRQVSVGVLPSIMVSWGGGPLEVVPTTSGWSLALYASLLAAPFFVGSLQVQLPFSVSGPGEMV